MSRPIPEGDTPVPKVKDVIAAMERIAPARLAEPRDRERIGLHSGDPETPVRRVALALDATLPAIEAAVKMRAEMLIVHHPRFYGGIRNLVAADPAGRRGVAMVRRNLAVFSAHTNLDVAPGGTNDLLAETAGLRDPRIVEPLHAERLLKLTVFVPASHVEQVRRALDDAGAGAIGNYSGCTFRARGTGTFRCGTGTTPFQGKPGSFEEADEFRLETVFSEELRERVVSAMFKAHPYEEVAYDLYPILGQGNVYGFGRVSELAKAETVAGLAARMAAATRSTQTQYSGLPGRKVRRVAVWAGAGVPVETLCGCGAEAAIVGEVGYHDIETFMDNGMSVIPLGHGFSEELVLKPLAGRLRREVAGVEFKVAGIGFISLRNV